MGTLTEAERQSSRFEEFTLQMKLQIPTEGRGNTEMVITILYIYRRNRLHGLIGAKEKADIRQRIITYCQIGTEAIDRLHVNNQPIVTLLPLWNDKTPTNKLSGFRFCLMAPVRIRRARSPCHQADNGGANCGLKNLKGVGGVTNRSTTPDYKKGK
jgi:hypothetical protein